MRRPLLQSALSALIIASVCGAPVSAATFKIVAADRMGEGFNDLTPRAPVGGNPGTTLGAQRLNVIRHAANIWGALLQSNVTIQLGAEFGPFAAADCKSTSALLGYAGPGAAFANFAGAPLADTLYPSALADSLAGSDLNPGGVDISAAFNQDIDEGCFSIGAPNGWYYGYDNNPPPGTLNLLQTVLHELAHGLGFASFVNVRGERCCGTKPMDDVFMANLEWHETGQTWPELSDEERMISARTVDGLHWIGPSVQFAGSYLTAGRTGMHVQMYAPAVFQSGASISHFSTALAPNDLLEPFLSGTPLRLLAVAALQDMGWVLRDALTPTPSATASASPVPTHTPTPPAPTGTATSPPDPTVTATPAAVCNCDCDGDGAVTISEVQGVAGIFLSMQPLELCANADRNGDGRISIQDVQRAAHEFLEGCP